MTTMTLGNVSLSVKDVSGQKKFYQEVIGLSVLKEEAGKVFLGIASTKEVLVTLIQLPEGKSERKVAGLYHLALLLPTRKDLSGILRHLLEIKAPLIGASDHGYSEALYLHDVEGNGIEIYWDKPREIWDIQPDGQIKGVTLEMKASEVLGLTMDATSKMPEGTKMGHVHLSVADFEKNEWFYQDILGMTLVDDLGGHARFFSVDGYHHHVGVNNWQGSYLANREETDLGILSYEMIWHNKERFDQVKANMKQENLFKVEYDSQHFEGMDPNGILIEMILE